MGGYGREISVAYVIGTPGELVWLPRLALFKIGSSVPAVKKKSFLEIKRMSPEF